MTNIECTNCADVVSVEATSVALPFVCGTCTNDAESYEAMAPAPTADLKALMSNVEIKDWTEYPTITELVDAGYATKCEPSHDATVENTTLLIEDLEQQVTGYRNALETANTLIADMSTQLQDDANNIGEQDRQMAELKADLDLSNTALRHQQDSYLRLSQKESETHRLNETLEQKMSELIDRKKALIEEMSSIAADADNIVAAQKLVIIAAADIIDRKNAEIERLVEANEWQKNQLELSVTKHLETLKSRNMWKRRAEYGRDLAFSLRRDIRNLENRGLLKRVFNVGA